MKKLWFIFAIVVMVGFDRPAAACTEGARELTSIGMGRKCERYCSRRNIFRSCRSYSTRWVNFSAWCPYRKTNYNPNIHTGIKIARDYCWDVRCNVGGMVYNNLSTCTLCSGLNQRVQDGVCYTVNCDVSMDSGYAIYVFQGAPKCLPLCDIKVNASTYEADDSTRLIFRMLKQNAGTVGTRT